MTGDAAVVPAGTATKAIRVVVAHERRLIADALGALIAKMDGFVVSGVVGCDFVFDAIAAYDPDLLVVGVSTGTCQVLQQLSTHQGRAGRPQMVIVADELTPALVHFSLEEGVSGLLLTDAPAWEVGECLSRIAHGHSVLPAGWQRTLTNGDEDPLESLSARQREVLELVAEGCSYHDIAARLCITVNTVKFHLRTIYARLGVGNKMAAARMLAHSEQQWHADGPYPHGGVADHP